MKTIIEPFRIKVVEPIRMTTPQEREAYLRESGFNLFGLRAEHVLIDLLTDSGTGAMSHDQWSGMMRGDESYAGGASYYRFRETLERVTGFPFILPTHQGRASERILFEVLCRKGHVVPNNNHFDTTRANIEHMGAEALDLVIEEGRVASSTYPFKGNMDIDRLEALFKEVGADRIPFVMVTVTNNSGGGQPVSLENLRTVRELCDRYKKPLLLDACRFAENAFLIKKRESGQEGRSPHEIARDMFELCDGATISAKKDGMVNIGGVLLIRDPELAQACTNLEIMTEGFVSYGGLAGRDLEAMAQGFAEVLEEDYLAYRIRSVEYLGDKLSAQGVEIVLPPGGHAIFIDAGAFCSHIPVENFPGQALAVGLYREAGIRSCEIGSVMFGAGGVRPPMELVRLAIPRRVYTQSHIDYVAEAVLELSRRRDSLRGLRIVEEPDALRHFTARFEEV